MKIKIPIIFFLIIIFYSIALYGKGPIIEKKDSAFNDPIIINNASSYNAFYGKISNAEDADFIQFRGIKGDDFYVSIITPYREGYKKFKPYLAIMGKGIFKRDEAPFNVNNEGLLILPPGERGRYYDDSSLGSYYKYQSIRGEIPKDGVYTIVVYSKDGYGKYGVILGKKNTMNIMDVLSIPINFFRMKFFFSPIETIIAIMGIILIGTALYNLYRKNGIRVFKRRIG